MTGNESSDFHKIWIKNRDIRFVFEAKARKKQHESILMEKKIVYLPKEKPNHSQYEETTDSRPHDDGLCVERQRTREKHHD